MFNVIIGQHSAEMSSVTQHFNNKRKWNRHHRGLPFQSKPSRIWTGSIFSILQVLI